MRLFKICTSLLAPCDANRSKSYHNWLFEMFAPSSSLFSTPFQFYSWIVSPIIIPFALQDSKKELDYELCWQKYLSTRSGQRHVPGTYVCSGQLLMELDFILFFYCWGKFFLKCSAGVYTYFCSYVKFTPTLK